MRRTHCKFYIAMVAYWYHLYQDNKYTEEQRVISLYCICHGRYEELSDHPWPNIGNIGVKPNMHFQIDFLNFYQFNNCAAETLLELYHCTKTQITKRIIEYALALCIAFYVRGKYLDQDTQDLLCLALILRGCWCTLPELQDDDLWSMMSDTIVQYHHRLKIMYISEDGGWVLNEQQLSYITEYFYHLNNIDLDRERRKWPIQSIIPKEMTLPLLPPKELGCCTVHGHSYHQERVDNIKRKCLLSNHDTADPVRCQRGCGRMIEEEQACLRRNWKRCVMCFPKRLWTQACDNCRGYFMRLEDECHRTHGKVDPSKCTHGCSQRYSVGVARMKYCKQPQCKYLY